MKDIIGQDIEVGATVLWLSGKGKYGGSPQCKVEKLLPKTVCVSYIDPNEYPEGIMTKSYLHPKALVVIDLNLLWLRQSDKLKQLLAVTSMLDTDEEAEQELDKILATKGT